MAAETASLNEEFLGISFRNVELLRKVEAAPELHSEWAVRFEKMANELKAKYPDNPRKVMELLLEEMVHNEAKKRIGAAKPPAPKEWGYCRRCRVSHVRSFRGVKPRHSDIANAHDLKK